MAVVPREASSPLLIREFTFFDRPTIVGVEKGFETAFAKAGASFLDLVVNRYFV